MLLTLMHGLWIFSTGCVDVGGVGWHVHRHVGTLCGVEREEGGYYVGFKHVEEILSKSFGV